MDEAGKADIRAASRVAFLRSFVGAFAVRITPAEVKIRFDTWFFVARAPAGATAFVFHEATLR